MTATDTPTPIPAIPRAAGALPLLGHAVPLLRDPLGFLRSLPHHGDLVAVRIGRHPAIVVCDTELLHQVLVSDRIFDKGGPLYDRGREFIGNGLVTCPHAQHRQQRRLLQPAFRSDLLPGYAQTMAVQIDEATSTWREGQIIDVLHETQRIASRTLIATLFGTGPDPASRDRISTDIATLVASVYRRTIQPGWLNSLPTYANTRSRRAVRRLHAAIAAYVAEQRARGDAGLIFSMLMDAGDTEGDKQGLSDAECIEQVTTFFIAGTETTAVTLAWALHLLATHPDLEREVRSEASRVLNAAGADPGQLPLTRAVVTEALRLYPPAWLSMRVTTTDTTLAGHPIPAGTTIVFSPYLIHRRPDLYPDPERFDPGRWTGAARHPLPRHGFVPFGGCARKCIGDQFALAEAVLALATIVGRWHLEAPGAAAFRPPKPLATFQPRGLRLRVTTPTARVPDPLPPREGRA
ncbi:cytochrome P450 [Streptomyces sp. NPDC091292]|uniref:cytochrome P450 n=1 Tax=Streptomyces sp. NPDC091292 TaxID=3365991 RepID=UPI0038195774